MPGRRWISQIGRLMLVLLGCYLVYCLGAFCFQRSILFPGQYQAAPIESSPLEWGGESCWLHLPFGEVELWFFPALVVEQEHALPTVVFAHGNHEIIDDWPQSLIPYRVMGLHVALVEFPGYGRSGGDPSFETLVATYEAAVDGLSHRPEVDPDALVYHGRSMGGGVVSALASRHPPAALILQSTFANLASMAWRYGLPPFLVRDTFDSIGVLRHLDRPVLVIHGTVDELVPVENGRALAAAALQGRLWELPCGHNDCAMDEDYWQTVERFLLDVDVLE